MWINRSILLVAFAQELCSYELYYSIYYYINIINIFDIKWQMEFNQTYLAKVRIQSTCYPWQAQKEIVVRPKALFRHFCSGDMKVQISIQMNNCSQKKIYKFEMPNILHINLVYFLPLFFFTIIGLCFFVIVKICCHLLQSLIGSKPFFPPSSIHNWIGRISIRYEHG